MPPANEGAPLTETQKKILRAALELFAERGYAATTTAVIAARAGVAEKTLFAQFKNKETLFDRVLSPAALEAASPGAISSMVMVMTHPWDKLEDLVTAVMQNRVDFALQHRQWLKLIAQELLLRPDLFERFVQRAEHDVWPAIEALFLRLQQKGEMRQMPAAVVCRTLISMTAGYVLYRGILRPNAEWNDEQEIRMMTEILVSGLRP